MKITTEVNDKALVRRLIAQFNLRSEDLELGKEYSLEAILGKDYWEDEDDCHLALGHAFSALVSSGRAPFSFAGFTKDRHNKYLYRP